MHLPISVTQDELLEVLLQVAPVRPVFIYNVSHHISLYFPVSLSYSSTGIFPLRQVVPSR